MTGMLRKASEVQTSSNRNLDCLISPIPVQDKWATMYECFEDAGGFFSFFSLFCCDDKWLVLSG